MKILVTGGAGYIGSHTCLELLNFNHDVVVVDNLINSKKESLIRVEKITGKNIKFYKVDLLDKQKIEDIFKNNKIDTVIHFAGLKAIGESMEMPLKYYHNNITGTLILCEVMQKYGVKKLIFSSSATVYGNVDKVPITEEYTLSPTNPYGRTKLYIEQILGDLFISDNDWSIIILRYFNPIGAHESGLIGEDPNGVPNNLMPYVTQVAAGKIKELRIFGNDYDTHDGTGIRDYIHVVDLAKGHVKALDKVMSSKGVRIYNLGTGKRYSVFDIVNTFEKVTGINIPYRVVERRCGDVAKCFADSKKANEELGWICERNLEDMCRDAWRWQEKNPFGYGD